MKWIIWNKTTDTYWREGNHEWTDCANATRYSLEQLAQMAFRQWPDNEDVFGLPLLSGLYKS